MKTFDVQYTVIKQGAKTYKDGVYQGTIQVEREWTFQAETDVRLAVQEVVRRELGHDYHILIEASLHRPEQQALTV